MKHLWTYIEGMAWNTGTKCHVAMLICGVLSALIGLGLWLVVRNRALSTCDWMICFVGYPVVISCFGVFFRSCNHDFHDGAFRKN